MKQLLIAFSAFLIFQTGFAQARQKPLVVATASIFADMAQVIGGNMIEVRSIVPIGGDPHLYEPTPADARLVASAQLILKNELTFEGWLGELISNSGTKARVVAITEGIAPIASEKYKNSTDPHAWMNADNGIIYIDNILKALSALDPANADSYAFNHGIYKQQLEELDRNIAAQIQSIPASQRILITSHDAFRYYGRRYGIRVEAVLGTSTDADAQTSDLVRLNKVIKENKVPAVFIESTVNPKLLQQLASDNHIVIGGKLYSDSIGDKDSPAPTYIDMLKYNTATIVNALSVSAADSATSGKEEIKPRPGLLLWSILIFLMLGGFVFVLRKLSRD